MANPLCCTILLPCNCRSLAVPGLSLGSWTILAGLYPQLSPFLSCTTTVVPRLVPLNGLLYHIAAPWPWWVSHALDGHLWTHLLPLSLPSCILYTVYQIPQKTSGIFLDCMKWDLEYRSSQDSTVENFMDHFIHNDLDNFYQKFHAHMLFTPTWTQGLVWSQCWRETFPVYDIQTAIHISVY